MSEKYLVELTPITAVHIGTGYEFSPIEYTVKQDKTGKEKFMQYSSEKIYKLLPDNKKEEFFYLIEEDKLFKIANLLSEFVNEDNANYVSDVTSTVVRNYKDKLKSTNNQLLIAETYKNPVTKKPVIPGSSIKGAIRTAIVSEFAKTRKIDADVRGFEKYFEKNLLNFSSPQNDPFRTMCVTDCELEGNKLQRIGDFSNYKVNKKTNKPVLNSIQMMKEHIVGQLLNGDGKGYFEITIYDDFKYIRQEIDRWQPIDKTKIPSLETVIESCNNFYLENVKEEYIKFYKNVNDNSLKNNWKQLLTVANSIKSDNNECLIRVGMFSQVENVTVSDYRKPWNKKGYGNTRTITEDYFPVGWVKLKFIPFDKAKQYLFEQKKRLEEEKAKQEEKRKKDAEEKQRIANMSKEEKLLLQMDKIDVNGLGDVYKQIIEAENKEWQIKLASKLKTIWQSYGKWNKKDCTKKQFEKVKVIENILNNS